MINFIEIVVIILGAIAIPVIVILNKTVFKNRTRNEIAEVFKDTMEEKDYFCDIKIGGFKTYDIRIESNDSIFLIKYYMMGPRKELFVTSKYRWQVEGGSSSYLFLKGIEPFIRYKEENNDKKIRKIVLLYPTSLNTMIYVNDVQTEFITPKIDVYGTRIINLDEIHDKFTWLLDDEHTKVRH